MTNSACMFDFETLKPDQFEVLVFHLVEALGYLDVVRRAGPGDRGEDVTANLDIPIPGLSSRTERFVFQAKRSKRISRADIVSELAKTAGSGIDAWILVTTASPQPELRRWFDRLSESGEYHFRIDAWWRDDLERRVRDNSEALAQTLPAPIATSLKLDAVIHETVAEQLAAVAARCRDIAQAQIERYARTKYIPNLYVKRSVQQRLALFLRQEGVLAQEAKSDAQRLAKSARSAFKEQIGRVKTSIQVYERRRRSAKDPNLQKVHSASAEFLNHVVENSSRSIADFEDVLEKLESAANLLPDTRFFRNKAGYSPLFLTIKNAQRAIDRFPRFSVPVEVRNTPKPMSASLDVSILDVEPSQFNFHEHFRNTVAQLEALHRHATVLIDRAGSGKTNLICHLADEYASQGPVILLFGKQNHTGEMQLVESVIDTLQRAMDTRSREVADELDAALETNGSFITVFIDGINEHRRVHDYDTAVSRFLEWSSQHRMRVILTCRDIYWEFFSHTDWATYLQSVIREELREFSTAEYRSVLPLYLSHYRIECELADEARKACQQPLILRFFCEAFGSVGGERKSLGPIRDIRLRELFEHYLSRKADEIRRKLGHQNAVEVEAYLTRLVSQMYVRATATLPLSEIAEITGVSDMGSDHSLYLHLLDEDIVIEEQPADTVDEKKVTFVYEEFMEFMLAKSIIAHHSELGVPDLADIFAALKSLRSGWVNARGIGEYVAQMCVSSTRPHLRELGVEMLRGMATDDTWASAFWSVLGKVEETAMSPDLYDVIPLALARGIKPRNIKQCLTALHRYRPENSQRLAFVLLWSTAVPMVLTWTDLHRISELSIADARKLGKKLAGKLRSGNKEDAPEHLIGAPGAILDTILPFVDKDSAVALGRARDTHFRPLVKLIWKAIPEYQPLLLNGLFDTSEATRVTCADRVRFVNTNRPQIAAILTELARAEGDTRVGNLLSRSVWELTRR